MLNLVISACGWLLYHREYSPWKSLETDPPKIGEEVVIWDGDGVFIDTYCGKDEEITIWYHGSSSHRKATHWMSIPPPPKH